MALALLAADMKSDLKDGLEASAAAQKLEEDGPNVLDSPPKITFLMLFLIQLTQFIIALLLGACVVSAAMHARKTSSSVQRVSWATRNRTLFRGRRSSCFLNDQDLIREFTVFSSIQNG